MDVQDAELLARLTARTSAALFAAALVLFALDGRRRGAPGPRSLRGLAAFVGAHTIHFASVAWLAVVSEGKNIAERGGWGPVLTVAAVFYVAAALLIVSWRIAAHGRHASRALRQGSHTSIVLIALVFLNSYASRFVTRPVFALPALMLLIAVAMYFTWGSWTAPCSTQTRAEAAKLG